MSKAVIGICLLCVSSAISVAAETPLHPVESYCARYEVSGVSKGTFSTCQRAWGRERYEQWDTATGFGPFKKKERKHVIYLNEHIFTYDRAAKRPKALRTVNPIYEDLVRHMRGRSPKELQKSFMQAMRYSPTGEQRTVGEVGCTVSRSPTVGEVCLTPDGILVEQRVLGQTQRLIALELGTSGDAALYDPEQWGMPIQDGPDVRKILRGLQDAMPEGR